MKKLYVVLYIICLIIPLVSAELELEEIRVYVNGKRYYDADEGGGDIYVKRNDDLMVRVYLENRRDNTTYVRLKGVLENIDDGDDIVEWNPDSDDWFDINANDEESKALSFNIPDDANYDEYDLELDIDYRYKNDTNGTWEYSWDVIVERFEEETNVEEKLEEIKVMIRSINKSPYYGEERTYYNLYLDCFKNFTVCNEFRNTQKSYESDYQDCVTLRDSYKTQKDSCERINTETQTSLSLCTTERQNYKNQRTMFIFLFGGLGLLLKWGYDRFWRERKKTGRFLTGKEISPEREIIHPDFIQSRMPEPPKPPPKPRESTEIINPDNVYGGVS